MRKPRHLLFTIGYSGYTVDSFIDTLRAQDVSMLLDVRMTPISRKRGFSKSALRVALAHAGIAYQHARTLGSPAELRRELHMNRDYDAFFAAYREYLNQQTPSVNEAAELVAAERVCLMCVEQHPHECHRSVVADAIAVSLGSKLNVRHLPEGTRSRSQTVVAV